jgi:hypothetical protein
MQIDQNLTPSPPVVIVLIDNDHFVVEIGLESSYLLPNV